MSSNVDRKPIERVLTDDTVQYERDKTLLHMPRTMQTVYLMRKDCTWLIDVMYQDNSHLFSIYHLVYKMSIIQKKLVWSNRPYNRTSIFNLLRLRECTCRIACAMMRLKRRYNSVCSPTSKKPTTRKIRCRIRRILRSSSLGFSAIQVIQCLFLFVVLMVFCCSTGSATNSWASWSASKAESGSDLLLKANVALSRTM